MVQAVVLPLQFDVAIIAPFRRNQLFIQYWEEQLWHFVLLFTDVQVVEFSIAIPEECQEWLVRGNGL